MAGRLWLLVELLLVVVGGASAEEGVGKVHHDLLWTSAPYDYLQKAFSPADYSALMRNVEQGKTLVKPKTKLEHICSSVYAQMQDGLPIPASLYDLPQNIASSYTTMHALTRITDLLVSFNESNRVFVLIGDSISRNSLESLECILNIENGFDNVEFSPPLLSAKIRFGASFYTVSFPHPENQHKVCFNILYLSVWERFKLNNVDWILSEISRNVFSNLFHGENARALITFNIGLHEHGEAAYRKNLNGMFAFANKTLLQLGKYPRSNVFIYRETTAQHFNLSAGYYDYEALRKWKSKKRGRPYQCVASSVTDNPQKDWRFRAEKDSIEANPHVKFVPFHDISRHYHDIHPYSFKRSRKKSNIDIDCTHFESKAAVTLYRILWHYLLTH